MEHHGFFDEQTSISAFSVADENVWLLGGGRFFDIAKESIVRLNRCAGSGESKFDPNDQIDGAVCIRAG